MSVHLGTPALMSALGIQNGDSVIAQQGRENPVYFLYLTVVTIVLAGSVEEFIFRGIAFGELRRLWEPAPVVALSSLVFVSIHLWLFSDGGLYVLLGMVLAPGSVPAVVYERNGNLLVVTLVYGLCDATQLLAGYMQVTGPV